MVVWYTFNMKSNEFYKNKFFTSIGFSEWGEKNPLSKEVVIDGVNEYDLRFGKLAGATLTLKNLAENSRIKSGQWWGFLSEIRCSLWLSDNGFHIDGFNVKTVGNNNADIGVESMKIDVVSFGPDFSDPKPVVGIWDEPIIENLAGKINEKFDRQKADLVVCDDIFSNDSNAYKLAPYFWEEAETSRKDLFRSCFGERLNNIAVVSFTSDMMKNPIIRFIRPEFEEQLRKG